MGRIARLGATLALVSGLLCAGPAFAQAIVVPERGTALRGEVLNAVRPVVERETGGPVIFVVGTLNVMGDWAYVDADPQRPGGKPIDWRKTRFRRAYEADMFSGLVMALLRRKDGVWTVVDHVVGPTDVYWYNWLDKYKLPEALFTRQSG
jgi:hypothetical protein